MSLLTTFIHKTKALFSNINSSLLGFLIAIFIVYGHVTDSNAQKAASKAPQVVKAGNPIVKNVTIPPTTKKLSATKNIAGQEFINGDFGGISNFITYSTEQGLPLSNITCGCEDKFGNLWFGTSGAGACRFDGKTFKTFTTKHGLAGNNVRRIIEDSKGNIWFATDGNGASKYDGKLFIEFTGKQELGGQTIIDICEDNSGNLWLCTVSDGVLRYDGKSFTSITTNDGLINNQARCINKDRSGKIWIGTKNGVSCYDNGSFVSYTSKQGLPEQTILAIYEDTNGDIWFTTYGGGVSRYNGKTFESITTDSGLASNSVRSIYEDQKGNIWFGTFGGGASFYDGKSFRNYTIEQGLSNNYVNSIFEDKTGNLWFCTGGGGICRYEGNAFVTFTNETGLSNNDVASILEDKAGNIWFATVDGLNQFNGKTFSTYTKAQGLSDNYIMSMIEDESGNLWLGGAAGGVSCFNGHLVKTYTQEQGLPNNNIYCLLEDRHGNIWMGTGAGACKFDGENFTTYTTEQGLAGNYVFSLLEDKAGKIWLATWGGGVSCFDGNTFTNYTTQQGLVNNITCSLLEDKDGKIWIGTQAGLSCFDHGTFSTYTTTQGLEDDYILQISEDSSGRIFLGTNRGVSVISGWNGSFPIIENFSQHTGYPLKEINQGQNAMYINSKDIAWIGTGDDKTALVRFDYNSVKKDTNAPKLVIQNIKIDEEIISWYDLIDKGTKIDSTIVQQQEIVAFGRLMDDNERTSFKERFNGIKFSKIRSFYPIPENLVLPYKNNHITFEFSAIAMSRQHLINYQYRLKGYDNDWSPVTNSTSAVFGNVREGIYTFELKAQNPAGIWSKPLIYRFEVLPPWYRTILAFVSYIILLALLIYTILIVYSRRLKAANIQLEKLVNERTREIAKQNEILEAQNIEIQTQAVELEKAVATKDKFFSIVAHDLKNPFNIIAGYASLLNTEYDNFPDEMKKKYINEIDVSSKSTYSLLINLLTWARSQQGRIEIKKENLNLYGIIDEGIASIYPLARKKDIQIIPKVSDNIYIEADRYSITTVINNLVSNAVKFTHSEGSITISAKAGEKQVEISIKDTGVGMSPEVVEKLFRIDKSHSTYGTHEEKGTGLGLILCKEFVEKNDGEITVESIVGEGSTFKVILPKGVETSFLSTQ